MRFDKNISKEHERKVGFRIKSVFAIFPREDAFGNKRWLERVTVLQRFVDWDAP